MAIEPELADMVAVGVPVLILMAANLADAVAFDPTNRSRVSLTGEIVPAFNLQ